MNYLCYLTLLHSAIAYAVTLPTPSGPFHVSLFTTALTDASRLDPYAPSESPHARKLMISVFIPKDNSTAPCTQDLVPYMTPLVAADFDNLAMTAGLPNGTFSELNMKICKTFANDGCMKSHKGRRGTDKILRPLLLFSPGFGQSRLVYNAMAHSVASEGYIVVSIDHPYDANVVEYPDRSYVRAANISSDDEAALNALIDVRAQDVSFVTDELQNSATLRQVIGKSGNMIDFGKVLMYGHSLGGATAATVMLADGRIRGGVNLDGRFFDKVLAKGISHPFLNVGRPNHRLEDSTWDQFYNSSSGPIVEVQVAGTLHAAFTDFPVVVGTWNPNDSDVVEALQAFLGTIPWMRAGEIVTRLVTTFAEFVFDGRNSTILSGTDSSFAEVGLVRSQLHQ